MFRYAILSAVSTAEQAKKTSLDDQIQICRNVNAKGWRESAGPFIIHGQSRTKYLNLLDAEKEIPVLREMLEAARHGDFDVLVVYDHDRLRDLLALVYSALSDYRVQLYSYSMPADPVDPKTYDPYESDTAEMLIGLSTIRSKSEIARMRRKYRTGMRNRITVYGIPTQIPFGYRKPLNQAYNRKAVPEPIPDIAAHLIHIKNMLLGGSSINALIDYLQNNQVAPPRGAKWYPNTIRDMLRNPFYAGKVRFEVSKSKRDRRLNKKMRDRHIPEEQQIIAAGKHTPLWTESEHHAIVEELKRRGKHFPARMVYPLTSLLKCGECHAPLYRWKNGPRAVKDRAIWRCSQFLSDHPAVIEEHFYPPFLRELSRQLSSPVFANRDEGPRVSIIKNKLDEMLTQRKRLEDAYLRGLFPLEEFEQRARDLDEKIKHERQGNNDIHKIKMRRENWQRNLSHLPKTETEIYQHLLSLPDKEVNHHLRLFIKHILIFSDDRFEVEWNK